MTTETYVVDSKGRPVILKDPDAILDYTWDWTDWLLAISDTIASKQVIVNGVTLVSSQIITGNKMVTAWLSGGVLGQTATATCRITTASGRVDDRTIYLKIRDR